MKRKPELRAPASGLLDCHWAAITSRPGGGQAGNQHNFALWFEARRLRGFFFLRRFRELSSTDGSRRPNLREEIAVFIAVEDELRLGLPFRCLGCAVDPHCCRARRWGA